ncbi:hypothetical protein ACVWWO_005303 [Bradyrhizobium sp. F1.13.1]
MNSGFGPSRLEGSGDLGMRDEGRTDHHQETEALFGKPPTADAVGPERYPDRVQATLDPRGEASEGGQRLQPRFDVAEIDL